MRWLVLLLASSISYAETPDPARLCKPVGQATIDAAAARLRNEARFHAAVDKRGLRLVVPAREPTTVSQKVAASTVVTLRRGRRDVRFVVGPVDGEWEFATNARGNVFAIERRPTARRSSLPVACGCYPETTTVVTRSRMLYALPDGAVFGGVVFVEYAEDAAEVVFNNRQRDGTACPFLATMADPMSDFVLPRGWRDVGLAEDHPRMRPVPAWKSRLAPNQDHAYVDWPFE